MSLETRIAFALPHKHACDLLALFVREAPPGSFADPRAQPDRIARSRAC